MKIPTLLSTAVLFMCSANCTYADTVKIDLPAISTYPSISDAYTAAADGATVMLQETVFNEQLRFSESKSIQLNGGYDSNFTPTTGNSIVHGTLKISGGTVIVQNVVIQAAGAVPDVPTGVTATAGATPSTVTIHFIEPNNGSSPITGYTVVSTPAGISATGLASPLTVTCPSTCAGFSFAVFASNLSGDGVKSVSTDVITIYDIVTTFLEPDTAPRNSIFTGSFEFNLTTGTVSNLQGFLSESMTGDSNSSPASNYGMTWLSLNHQLSSLYDATLGGLRVTTFFLPDTFTLSNNPAFGGTNGWEPGTGSGLYYGFPGPNPGNAYARIFVNRADPTTVLSQAQIDTLAYADCSPGGMMGATCMTGTTMAGYGTLGSMHGYPLSQVVTSR